MTHTIRILIRLAAAGLMLAVGSACQRHAYGASLGAQLVAGGATEGDGNVWHVQSGASVSTWSADIQAKAATKPPAISLGSGLFVNQAATWKGDRGWTADDEAVVSWTVASIPRATCVEVILPAVTPAAEAAYPGLGAQVDQARAWMTAVLGPRVDRLADWRPWVDAHPDQLPDGIHLGTQAAIDAYADLTHGGCL